METGLPLGVACSKPATRVLLACEAPCGKAPSSTGALDFRKPVKSDGLTLNRRCSWQSGRVQARRRSRQGAFDDEGKDAKPGVKAGLKELDHAWSRLDKMIISY